MTRDDGLQVIEYDDRAIVKASGSLGVDSERVGAIIRNCLEKGDRRLVLDMKAVPYINSDGLRMLQEALRQADEAQASLSLANANDNVLRTLSLSQVDKLVQVFSTVRDALRAS